MNKDDDFFGWPNNFDHEDDPIILNWQYLKDLLLGMLAIIFLTILLFILIICIKSIAIYILTNRFMMLNFLYLLIIPMIFFILNLSKWISSNRFLTNYQLFWRDRENMKMKTLKSKTQEIISLLEGADIAPLIIITASPIGYGRIQEGDTSSFDNFFHNDQRFVEYNTLALYRAKEVYRKRMIRSINPLAWLEVLIFLPQTILKYLGVSEKNITSKILNIIYWVAAIVAPIILEPVRSFIEEIVKNILG